MDSVKRGEMIKKTQKYKKIYFCVLGCNPLLLATGIALALCRMSVYAVISISFSLGALAFAFIPFAKYTCWYPINSMRKGSGRKMVPYLRFFMRGMVYGAFVFPVKRRNYLI